MWRNRVLTPVVVILACALAAPLFAQQTEDICVGGGLVARLRVKGSFPSVAERAAQVNKTLTEIISYKDTQHPVVTLKQKNKLWTVYAWNMKVVSVYPAEAKANDLAPKQLGAIWVRNLQQRLPKATPCSKLPPDKLGYKPGHAAKPATAHSPVKIAMRPVAVTGSPTKPAATTGATESGAMLLIIDALHTARQMNEQDWVTHKESMARNLYNDLNYYITGHGTPPKLPAATKPVKPVAKPAPKPAPKPVVKPAAKPMAKPVAKPAAAQAPKAAATAAKQAHPAAPVNPAMAKVPQKNRIRKKFALAKDPYLNLQATDPQAAKPIGEMLAASRQAFARGDFDEAEHQLDAALAALGVSVQ